DVLSDIDTLKVCIGYKYECKERYCAYPGIDLYKVEPILVEMEPFSIDETVTKDNMPAALKKYLKTIENQVGIPISS
ncbi:adenylosuccinate synthetase, partial [Francisella tularensis subsp. holarctica]|uniref:adenylosuccinate synthetase n=1 Tax=Francisella tularensis TaxID=263 RepID=UPI002381BEF2